MFPLMIDVKLLLTKMERLIAKILPSPTQTLLLACIVDMTVIYWNKLHREKCDFLKEKGLCFGCLNTGHLGKSCDRRITCKQCSQMHPSVLHIGQRERAFQKGTEQPKGSCEICTTSSTCGHTGAGHRSGILPIVPVQVKSSKGNKVIETYAFLHPGSTGTFCSEKRLHKLNTTRTKGQDPSWHHGS